MKPRPPIERFWGKVDKSGDCWLWTAGLWGSRKDFKYGKFFNGTKHVTSHRFALEEHLGRPLKENMRSLHHCDNCLCVRPDHLFEGTQRDNMIDMMGKSRGKGQWSVGSIAGEKHPSSKLTHDKVAQIRSLAGTMKQADIGRIYGIKQAQVSRIVRRVSWG
jgi:hypothetical protein